MDKEKEKKVIAEATQTQNIEHNNRPASDIYSHIEGKDPETGVEKPTEDAVLEAKDWVDKENKR